MVISTCGFGSSGSSVITDYLSEYTNIKILDQVEFNISYLPDGLADLCYHICSAPSRTLSSSYAIDRFLQLVKSDILDYYSANCGIDKFQLKKLFDDYIESITEVKWNGFINTNYSVVKSFFQSLVLGRINPLLRKKTIPTIKGYPHSVVRVSHDSSVFYNETKKLVCRLLELMGGSEGEKIVLDQAFSGNNPQASFAFFDNPRAIVVDRDPRDLYIFSKEFLIKKPILSRTLFMPTEGVREFIDYYRIIRKNQPYTNDDPRILRIRFEELIYDYDKATKKVSLFCELGENEKKMSVFVPEMSAANTQLVKKFPSYIDDVKQIEKELPEYCFDFEKYPPITVKGEMFSGKSILNKK